MELTLSLLKPYPRSGHSYALGASVALELFRHRPEAAVGLIVSPLGKANAGVSELIRRAETMRLPILSSDKAIARLSPKGNCYAIGVFAPWCDALEAASPHIVLVAPGDAGNVGTIARTACAFGIADVAVAGGVDPLDPRVVRGSMGAVFRMRVAHLPSFEAYSRDGRRLYPFMLDGAASLADTVPEPPWSIILGNEASGLPASFSSIGTPVRIDQSDAVDSLNLAVAAGIGLWHFTQPRG